MPTIPTVIDFSKQLCEDAHTLRDQSRITLAESKKALAHSVRLRARLAQRRKSPKPLRLSASAGKFYLATKDAEGTKVYSKWSYRAARNGELRGYSPRRREGHEGFV